MLRTSGHMERTPRRSLMASEIGGGRAFHMKSSPIYRKGPYIPGSTSTLHMDSWAFYMKLPTQPAGCPLLPVKGPGLHIEDSTFHMKSPAWDRIG